MPLRRAQPPPDLGRVARILDGRGGAGGREEPPSGRGWVPVLSGSDRASRAPRPREPDPSPSEQLEDDLRRSRRPGVVTAPEPLRGSRWWVSTQTVVAVLALVVAVAGIFAVRVLWADRDTRAGTVSTTSGAGVVLTGAGGAPARVPGPLTSATGSLATTTTSVAGGAVGGGAGSAGAGSAGAGSAGAGSGGAAAGPTGVLLVVHVVGQVRRPGLVRLPPGSRVADAVAAAGGATSGADVAALNLARLVVDGEQLHVPREGEVLPPAIGGVVGGPTTPGGAGGGHGVAGSGTSAPVSLNTADVASLDTLPGVGPVLAQRILDWRTEHGRFTSVDELGEVSGIGDKLLAQLRPRVTL